MNINEDELKHLTEEELHILITEIKGRDGDESEEEVYDDVINNMESYVREHRWWNQLKGETNG